MAACYSSILITANIVSLILFCTFLLISKSIIQNTSRKCGAGIIKSWEGTCAKSVARMEGKRSFSHLRLAIDRTVWSQCPPPPGFHLSSSTPKWVIYQVSHQRQIYNLRQVQIRWFGAQDLKVTLCCEAICGEGEAREVALMYLGRSGVMGSVSAHILPVWLKARQVSSDGMAEGSEEG